MLDNWALLHAAEVAQKNGSKLAVCFNLVDSYLEAGARQFGFMLRGLQKLAPELEEANIRFLFLRGDPADTVPALVSELNAALLVVDQAPLRLPRQWKDSVKKSISCPMHEVDAHNIVPVRSHLSHAKLHNSWRRAHDEVHRVGSYC
jgi:deoxyribodipyrimidine photo-lyase